MDLLKLDIAAPRYTSYPTVPYWENNVTEELWKEKIRQAFLKHREEGISLYLHLPFCESLCTYCACNTRITVNHKVEEGYIRSLLKEWQLYLALFEGRPLIREIHLGGGTPTFFSPENLKTLLDGILSKADKHQRYEFSFEGHPGNTLPQHLEVLAQLGFSRVSFGVQDFDEQVQEAINRYQSFEEVKYVVEEARAKGYRSVNIDLVYGLPHQHLSSVKDTLEKVIALKPERIAFYSYAHVPWLKSGQRKYSEKDLPGDLEKRALYELGKNMLIREGYKDVGMDHFALPGDDLLRAARSGNLHRNFMGYTTQGSPLLIGLGASSISDSWEAFAQNLKVVEEYQKRVEEGHYPIFRGHVLNEEDLLIRSHLLDLMCKYSSRLSGDVKWKKLYEGILDRLEPFLLRKLVEKNADQILIREVGRAYLRNIGLCFDERYWRKLPEKQVFSNTA